MSCVFVTRQNTFIRCANEPELIRLNPFDRVMFSGERRFGEDMDPLRPSLCPFQINFDDIASFYFCLYIDISRLFQRATVYKLIFSGPFLTDSRVDER